MFTHVGDHVRIQTPNGRSVSPIVTGTFGSSDFTHSLLGEAGDKLSEASVSDLQEYGSGEVDTVEEWWKWDVGFAENAVCVDSGWYRWRYV